MESVGARLYARAADAAAAPPRLRIGHLANAHDPADDSVLTGDRGRGAAGLERAAPGAGGSAHAQLASLLPQARQARFASTALRGTARLCSSRRRRATRARTTDPGDQRFVRRASVCAGRRVLAEAPISRAGALVLRVCCVTTAARRD